MRAICDFVYAKIRFSYADAGSTRCASDSMHEGVGVCRDLAHLALALCRCMNIPALYWTGYLGDIGVPVDINPMDFSAWSFCRGAGTRKTRVTTIPASAALSWSGRDAADVAMSTAFGVANLARFEVATQEQVQQG